MRELQPKLKMLSEKFGKDKEGLAKAQMSLYKQEGVNPLSGCLPNILQIAVLLMFFSAFNMVTLFSQGKGSIEEINRHLVTGLKIDDQFKFDSVFLGNDLALTPAKAFGNGIGWNLWLPVVLLLGSGVFQYLGSKLMMPEAGNKKVDASAFVKATADKEDDMMAAMRTQSLYMMPAMTVVLGWNFSLGVLLYWFVNSVVMYGQQVLIQGFGDKK